MATGGRSWLSAARRRTGLLLGLLAVLATTLVVSPQAAQAAVVAGRLTVTPGPAIAQEAVTFKGAVPPRRSRPVALQRRYDVGWVPVTSGRTSTAGAFAIRTAAPKTTGSTSYRVFTPAVGFSGRVYPAVATPAVRLATVPQQGTLSAPDHSVGSETFTATASFTPARPGRPVTLQKSSGETWTTVRTGAVEDALGRSSWKVNSSGSYRAVAATSSGAQQVVAGPNLVRELTAEEVWLPTDRCRDVVWLGARGSDQGQQDFDGLGAEVHGAWRHYLATLHDVDAGFYGVVYPAVPATPFQAVPAYQNLFAASIDSGVTSVLEFLRSRVSQCPKEHYVLAGFSQGAMVMHRTLFEVLDGKVGTPQGAPLASRIDGVLAIADGDKRAGQGGHTYATADPEDAYGISWLASWATSSGDYDAVAKPVPDIDTWPSSRYHDVCLRGDTICDYGTAFMWTDIDLGIDLHSNGYRARGSGGFGEYAELGLPQVRAAAADIAATTQAWATAPADIGPPPVVNFLESTSCTQPTVSLDNTLGLVPYRLSIRVTPTFGDSTLEPSTPVETRIAEGTDGGVSTPSLVNTPFGNPTRTVVEYIYSRADVPLGPGTGALRSLTFDC